MPQRESKCDTETLKRNTIPRWHLDTMCVQQSNLRLKFPVLSNTDLRWSLEQLELLPTSPRLLRLSYSGIGGGVLCQQVKSRFPWPHSSSICREFLQRRWSLHGSEFTDLKVFKFHPHSICFWVPTHKRMVMSPFITLPAVYDPITFSIGPCLSWKNKSTWPALWHLLLIFMGFYKNQGRYLCVFSRGFGKLGWSRNVAPIFFSGTLFSLSCQKPLPISLPTTHNTDEKQAPGPCSGAILIPVGQRGRLPRS